ncbi:lachrymatory-factor synthase [Ziziphus jujuba]|uniref:Lachrymatory-factor synthase n=2 Tax=Ziziphus jujuba TaxID=326968 RepID=A0A6P3ZDZ9_ZIZJJ|nr:lachrymatory-factor synthase [Ziziphus jujuba]KAH7524162.1 hypothetical protein FEM48_Zijuj06G0089900 [Ziziphus jujuba var. spinosa]
MEAEADAEANDKWEGKVSARLTKASAGQIWPLFKDFFNFHKWFPSLATSYGVHGTNGEPGCIRFCSGFSIPSNEGDKPVSWSKERLVAVDETEHRLCYEIVDSNIGFNSYMSTFEILPVDGQDYHHHHHHGCVIEWSFTVAPVDGWVLDDLVGKYQVGLQSLAQRMEDAFAN